MSWRQVYGHSGIYFGRKEGDDKDGHAFKTVQDAVELLKGVLAACQITEANNDPSFHGGNRGGAARPGRVLDQRAHARATPALIAIDELMSE